MRPIFKFIRTTLTGGILFLLPVIILIAVFNKAHSFLLQVSGPIAEKLPDIILGFDGSRLVAIALLIFICFVSGLMFRAPWVRKIILSLEMSVLSYLPGYALIKSITADTVGQKTADSLTTVLVSDGEGWKIGLLVEETAEFCTVFFPDAPRYDSGDVLILPASRIKKTGIPSHVAARSLKNYGKGAIQWMNKS